MLVKWTGGDGLVELDECSGSMTIECRSSSLARRISAFWTKRRGTAKNGALQWKTVDGKPAGLSGLSNIHSSANITRVK